MMRFTAILSALTALCVSCSQPTTQSELPTFSIWSGDAIVTDKTDKEIAHYLERLKSSHIEGLFLSASNDQYARIVPIAEKIGVQIHAWRWTMNNGKYIATHPEYYQVNGQGESCAEKPPYVDYYRWLCPNDSTVRSMIAEEYVRLAAIEGLRGVHFDYVRFCDVILPTALQPKYGLVQDHVMPEFDYCYCERCVSKFKRETGLDAHHLTNQADTARWNEFRYNAVVTLADSIATLVHAVNPAIKVTAAVFPTPAMSREMVLQDWGRFAIDAVFPMLYNGFYAQDYTWIGACVKEGLETMPVQKPIYAGIFIPDCNTPQSLSAAINSAMEAGASGISMFDFPVDNDELMAAVRHEYEIRQK